MSQYGYFDDNKREYVIVRPDTPLPWMNYIGNNDYLGIISNTAGGYSFYKDARLRRILRYQYNSIPKDNPGRYLYICDGKTVWNPHFKPVKTELDKYKCRHGLGYSIFESEKNGLKCSVKYFVPLGYSAEVIDLEITNNTNDTKELDIFSYIEFCLWNALDDSTNFQRNWNIAEVEIDSNTIYHKTEYRERRNHYAFFNCSEKIAGFDTDRETFIGRMGDYSSPEAVIDRKAKNSIANGWHPIASHQLSFKLLPGQSKRIIFTLGYIENDNEQKFTSEGVINKSTAKDIIGQLSKPENIDIELKKLREHWSSLNSTYQVKHEDQILNRMVNIWTPYQCMVTFNNARSASGFESGIGRGIGFRDSNQDVLGGVQIQPEGCRQRIIDLASTQISDGSCYHQYQPLTKLGNADNGTGFSDDPLWLIVSTDAYIRETGDLTILNAEAGFQDLSKKKIDTTLMDHLELSIKHVCNRIGPHGLPLIGHADWNDCLNLNCFSSEPDQSFQLLHNGDGDVAESVFVAELLVYSAIKLGNIFMHLKDKSKGEKYFKIADDMKQKILKSAWDGEWFIRAFANSGKPVGSKTCDEGKIYIETQGWAAMAGIDSGDGEFYKAVDKSSEMLNDKYGMVLQQPAYSKYNLELGEISSYPPGYKENAGIFCHNNTWMIIANCIAGRGDRAWELYKKISPASKNEIADIYKCEPYCHAQMIAGHDAASHGEAKNSWLTGTASWAYVALSQYILGIRPGYDFLEIDPCIPSDWEKFTVYRKFRGIDFTINIENPDGIMKGIKEIKVNGKQINGNKVSLTEISDKVEISVIMG